MPRRKEAGVEKMTTGVDTRHQMSMLQTMVGAAERDVERRRAQVSLSELEGQLHTRDDSRPFREALTSPGLSVIAEFKRRSPSAGNIDISVEIADQVRLYQRAGAVALSILTDAEHFGGQLDDLREARSASDLPVLRKDFTVDRYQLYEAVVHGADAVLLIAAVLQDNALSDLYDEAQTLDLDCIVEVRTLEELERALGLDADIIGINNRDLETLDIDVGRTFALLKHIPTGKTVVSESGIEGPDQMDRLQEAGIDAALIGHALMGAADPEAQMRRLLRADEGTREHHLP
jgi:indole-3-glycerol phosphate synthase